MSRWHRVAVVFSYASTSNPAHRAITSVTLQVYGSTETAVVQALRKMYPHWTDFELLEIGWET